ncbi:MAG: hypothetical protein IJW22_06735 [Clostridia bacterium]|nr:hypothetical protein [Clostridia bacterium]
MPFFQQKSHRCATNSGEHPAVLRELERLYRAKCDTVMGDIRFSALLAPNLPGFSRQLSLLASTALPTLSHVEQALHIDPFLPQNGEKEDNVPPLSKENAHSVALSYCKKRRQAAEGEQASCRHLRHFARKEQTGRLLAEIEAQAGEEVLLLQGLQKRFLHS